MARLKRDPKTGRFLKRGKKRRAAKTTVKRKRRVGLKGHKPGCMCVIHARRRAVANRGKRRTVVRARPNRKVRRRNMTERETRSATLGGEVKLDAQETRTLRGKNKAASEEIRKAATAMARVLARKTGNLVEIVDARGKFVTSVSPPF